MTERKRYEPPAIEHSCSFGSAELVRLDSCGAAVLVIPAQRPYPHTSKRLELLHTLAAAAARHPAPRLQGAGHPMTLRFVASHAEAPRRLQRIPRRVDFFRRKSWRI